MNILLRNKYLFIDMDGTVAEYRSFDKVNCTYQECFLPGMYSHCRPMKSIIELISKCGYKEVYILSQIQCSINIEEKKKWLHEYMPFVKDENMFFIFGEKSIALDTYVTKYLNLPKEDVVLIDDTISILEQVENLGYTAYHISSLID